jgi:cbb3-type cytochrome oxidase subunit 3
MYLDVVVLSGVGVVALMVAFFGGVGYFLYRDAQKNKPNK